jgi:hypothetical protein
MTRSWLRMVAGRDFLLAAAAAASLIAGGILELVGAHAPASAVWAAATLALLVPLTISVGRSLLRRDVGVDAIALLAMAGALALGEYLAGAVIALMLAGGNALELVAQRRARRELTLLVDRAPKAANRITGDSVERIDVDLVQVGDRLLVRAGEVIPTDGVVRSTEAIVDDSALTGEPLGDERDRRRQDEGARRRHDQHGHRPARATAERPGGPGDHQRHRQEHRGVAICHADEGCLASLRVTHEPHERRVGAPRGRRRRLELEGPPAFVQPPRAVAPACSVFGIFRRSSTSR